MLFLIYTIDLHNRSTQAPRTNLKIVTVAHTLTHTSPNKLPTQTTNQSTPPHSTATADIFSDIVVLEIDTLRIVPTHKAKRHRRNEGRAADSTSAISKVAIESIAMKVKLIQKCTTAVNIRHLVNYWVIGASERRRERGRLANPNL